MTHFLAAAQRYAELGYPVFPCAPGRKTPLTSHGFHDATTDLDQIEAWWERWPNANVAIATAGLAVVDVDGPENAWLADEPERLLELAAGCVARTPGHGHHYYFRPPPGVEIRSQAGRLAPRVDVRGLGGYVLATPSIVAGKPYCWVEGLELDQPLERLPEPPAWLLELLVESAGSIDVSPGAASVAPTTNSIPAGQRNATLARLAGTMRRVGMSVREIGVALNQANHDRCAPPLSPAEVERIAASVGRYAPDQVAVALAEDHFQQMFSAQPNEPLTFAALSSQELDENDYELEYLINGILVRGQPGVIAGPKKTLKTNISIDLALSLSSGGRFLNHFAADRPARVGVMSGESGAATIQETARRIADAQGARLPQYADVVWSFEVPQLGDAKHIDALHRFITTHALEVLILDPTYLMMLGLGDNAGNLFIVGGFLKALGEISQATGCTPLLCHHLKKGVADPYEPAELDNIAWAGFQEFVRQWILLNRRVRYDPDQGGHHELWMSVGGSAGHSGLWGVNVEEGTRQDLGGRRWQVEVLSAAEAYADRAVGEEQATEVRKQRQLGARLQRQRDAVLRALEQFPMGETARVIRECAGVGAGSIQDVLDGLVEEGVIVACVVQKHTRREPAYRLATSGDVAGPGGP